MRRQAFDVLVVGPAPRDRLWELLNAESVGGSHTIQQGLLTRSVLAERLRRQRVVVERATVEA